MSENISAVNSLPKEGGMGKFIEDTPGEFLGQEVLNTSWFHNLRQLRAVAKGVWHEKHSCFNSKFLLQKSLSIKELSDHCFSRGHISIKFYPCATNNFKSTILNGFLKIIKNLRVFFFEPPILAYLRSTKFEILIMPHQFNLSAPASSSFPLCFCIRP